MVRFPHKQLTEWLDCSNCHEKLFKSKTGAWVAAPPPSPSSALRSREGRSIEAMAHGPDGLYQVDRLS